MVTCIKKDFLGHLSIKLDPTYPMEKEILEHEEWEPHVVFLIKNFVKKGDVCLDIGANIGVHTLAMAKCAESAGRVIAFEPCNDYYLRLVENVRLNPELCSIIECVRAGVGSLPGKLKLFRSGDGSNAYLAEAMNPALWNRGGAQDYEECDVRTIDEQLRGVNVNFIKADVEGMELDVFHGAESLIATSRPVIIFETLVSDFDPFKIEAAELFLRSRDYLMFGLYPGSTVLMPVTYPKLFADTLALPVENLAVAGHLISPFASYRSDQRAPGINGAIEITIVGLRERLLFVKFNQGTKSIVLSDTARLHDCTLESQSTGHWRARLQFDDPKLKGFHGILSIAGAEFVFRGERTTSLHYPS